MMRFHTLIVFNIVDQNEWNTKGMKISLVAAPASTVLFKFDCATLFIINGSNMRKMMMEDSQILRNIVRTIVYKKTQWRRKNEGGKIKHHKKCEKCFHSPRIISILIGTSANDFVLCAQTVSV